MSGLSRIYKECRECKFKHNCNNKLLEALAYAEMPKLSQQSLKSTQGAVLFHQNTEKEYVIGINTGVIIDINKSIQDSIYKSMGISAKYL